MPFPVPATRERQDLPSPETLAEELRHLPGFVYLDSSSAGIEISPKEDERFSILTACPELVIRGNLFHEKDFAHLREIYTSNLRSTQRTPDLGFPTDGLYGSVDYDGTFTFGLYRDYLVYDHCRQVWFESGDLTRKRQATPSESKASGVSFINETNQAAFCAMVRTAQDYIAAGDIYQVNLSHRFSAEIPVRYDAFSLYQRLRNQSPAPYSAYLNLGEREILSSSPEQFLVISGRTIQTRPIKGTRPRFRDREQDEKSAYDLITSSKEVAELIMITDLERNDLGQICEFGTVEATELLKLERYAQVFHLISTVEGTLRPEVDAVSALRACYPGGSITGAPKKRAREIIEELEPIDRGLYTGSIGCLGFNGESRFNIAIRTAVREKDRIHFHVGAGVVADSNPESEWEETLHKAAGILQTADQPGS